MADITTVQIFDRDGHPRVEVGQVTLDKPEVTGRVRLRGGNPDRIPKGLRLADIALSPHIDGVCSITAFVKTT
ncbi:MAG: hypothetical protein AAGA35_01895 [Patescibacteria group bacterium]